MAISEEWPIGQRHAHHGLDAKRSQRAQALVFRDHHSRDGHTHDGDYAALDEAFSRLDVLERPSTAKRLDRLRKLAKAREIRRQYNREANWLVANDEHLHYQHRLRLHEQWPDQHPHPGTEGLELRDEDVERIGPIAEDVHIECDNRIDDLRPRLSELCMAAILPFDLPEATLTLRDHYDIIKAERTRADLLTSVPIRIDYFEPKYWVSGHTNDLRNYMRQAILGNEGDELDDWHTLARDEIASSSDDADLIAVPTVVKTARETAKSIGVYTKIITDSFPAILLAPRNNDIIVSWVGPLPEGVSVVSSAVVVENNKITYERTHIHTSSSLHFTTVGTGRCAVLIQFEKTNLATRKSLGRTIGGITMFDVGNPPG